MSIDGFTGGLTAPPPPDASSNPPEKVLTPWKKFQPPPPPPVKWQYHEKTVFEGVLEHKNSLFSTNNLWGFATN